MKNTTNTAETAARQFSGQGLIAMGQGLLDKVSGQPMSRLQDTQVAGLESWVAGMRKAGVTDPIKAISVAYGDTVLSAGKEPSVVASHLRRLAAASIVGLCTLNNLKAFGIEVAMTPEERDAWLHSISSLEEDAARYKKSYETAQSELISAVSDAGDLRAIYERDMKSFGDYRVTTDFKLEQLTENLNQAQEERDALKAQLAKTQTDEDTLRTLESLENQVTTLMADSLKKDEEFRQQAAVVAAQMEQRNEAIHELRKTLSTRQSAATQMECNLIQLRDQLEATMTKSQALEFDLKQARQSAEDASSLRPIQALTETLTKRDEEVTQLRAENSKLQAKLDAPVQPSDAVQEVRKMLVEQTGKIRESLMDAQAWRLKKAQTMELYLKTLEADSGFQEMMGKNPMMKLALDAIVYNAMDSLC